MTQDFKICRLCLSKTKVYFDLNEDSNSTMLEAITAIKLDPLSSSETSTMCLKCRLNLKLAYSIQQKILKYYAEFENVLESTKFSSLLMNCKQEPVDYFEHPDPLKIVKEEPRESEHVTVKTMFSCSICHSDFRIRKTVQKHCSRKHPREKYTVLTVTREYQTSQNAPAQHKRLTCHVCNRSLGSKDSLRMHIHRYHSNKLNPIKCGHCGKQFKMKQELERHEKSMHGAGQPTEECETCGKKFYTLVTLNAHQRQKHLDVKKISCEFCKREFSSVYTLITHRRRHTDEKPFKCDLCGEEFRQKVSLRSHRSSKHEIEEEKNVECEVCGRRYVSNGALMTHKRVHLRGI